MPGWAEGNYNEQKLFWNGKLIFGYHTFHITLQKGIIRALSAVHGHTLLHCREGNGASDCSLLASVFETNVLSANFLAAVIY